MEWDKEKAMLEEISDCHKRVQWLASQLSRRVGPPKNKCDTECAWNNLKMATYGDACIKCWIKASGEAIKKAKEDAQA